MSQDSTSVDASTARAEEVRAARAALDIATKHLGTNPARVAAAERERDKARRERERWYDRLFTLLEDHQREDALVRAADEGDEAFAARLLRGGVSPGAVGSYESDYEDNDLAGYTALGAAIAGRHDGIVNLLLEAGALTRLDDDEMVDVLVLAVGYNDNTLVARLLDTGLKLNGKGSAACYVNSESKEGCTPLEVAIDCGHDGIFEQLLDAHATSANCEKESKELRPLMWAAYYSRPDCLRRLLEAGAAVNAQDRWGATALHYVPGDEDSPSVGLCARLLLDGGADKDARDERGLTPLMWAAQYNCPGIIKVLVEKGADMALTNKRGRTALQYAEAKGHDKVAALLRE